MEKTFFFSRELSGAHFSGGKVEGRRERKAPSQNLFSPSFLPLGRENPLLLSPIRDCSWATFLPRPEIVSELLV